MKKFSKYRVWFLLFVILIWGLVGCGNSETSIQTGDKAGEGDAKTESDEVITIKIADSFPITHTIVEKGTQPWIDRIEELGEGKIKIEYYPSEQLAKEASLLDTAKNKVADITYVGAQYITDKLPLSAVTANPGLVLDAVSGSKAYNKLLHEDLYELELKAHGVKPLWGTTANPYQIINSKHEIKTLEDIEGLKIRTSGGIQEDMVHSWGAVPVSTTAPEIFSAWERGTIDGTLLSLLSWEPYQIEKVAKYATVNASFSGFGIMYVVNEEVWNSWPEDVRNAVEQASEEIVEPFGQGIIEYENGLMDKFKELGIEFYELPEDELLKWNKSLKPFQEEWAKKLEAKGLPATEVLEKFIQYNEEFKQ